MKQYNDTSNNNYQLISTSQDHLFSVTEINLKYQTSKTERANSFNINSLSLESSLFYQNDFTLYLCLLIFMFFEQHYNFDVEILLGKAKICPPEMHRTHHE